MHSHTLRLVPSRHQAGTRILTMPARAHRAVTPLREGTTGRLLVVPRVWAVAAAAPSQPRPHLNEHRAQPQNLAPELAFYRKYTEGVLRRFQHVKNLHGRVNSLLGRELFNNEVSQYRVRSFDDVINFCVDVEKMLKRLQPFEQRLLTRITMQGYSQAETAVHTGVSLRHCIVRYNQSLDKLTAHFLDSGLLIAQKRVENGPSSDWCQEAKPENEA